MWIRRMSSTGAWRTRISDYPLRNVPPDLWASVKSRAALDQMSIRSVVIDLLRYYTQHGLPSFQRTEDPHG